MQVGRLSSSSAHARPLTSSFPQDSNESCWRGRSAQAPCFKATGWIHTGLCAGEEPEETFANATVAFPATGPSRSRERAAAFRQRRITASLELHHVGVDLPEQGVMIKFASVPHSPTYCKAPT